MFKSWLKIGNKGEAKAVPTVRFDPKQITPEIEKSIREWVVEESRILVADKEAATAAIAEGSRRGRDLRHVVVALTDRGMPKADAAEIALYMANRVTMRVNFNRQIKMGLTHTVWKHAGVQCGIRALSGSGVQIDGMHKSFHNKKFALADGLKHKGRAHWPGYEIGCMCTSSVIIPGFDE